MSLTVRDKMNRRIGIAAGCLFTVGAIALVAVFYYVRPLAIDESEAGTLLVPHGSADSRVSFVDEFAPGEYTACERQKDEYLQPVPPTRGT